MSETATGSKPDVSAAIAVEVERYLRRRVAAFGLPENLLEAIGYAVLGGGKRLRPQLTILCCEASGGDREIALGPAAALELGFARRRLSSSIIERIKVSDDAAELVLTLLQV